MVTLMFTTFFPISTVYSLGRTELTGKNFVLIGCYYLAAVVEGIVCAIMAKVLFRSRWNMAFAHMFSNTMIINIIISGIPITTGFFEDQVEEVTKYAYILVCAQFTSSIPISLYLFEYADLKEATNSVTCRQNLRLILTSIHKTVKNPMILGIIGGLVYNGVRAWWVP